MSGESVVADPGFAARLAGSDQTRSTYKILPESAQHKRKIKALGIEENLIRPDWSPSRLAIQDRRWWRKQRSLSDLKDTWRPTRMRFIKQWPVEEMESGWFEHVYIDLWLRVKKFADDCFGFADIKPEAWEESVWLAGKFSKEFMFYASLVARQDRFAGGWDGMLTKMLNRKYLVMGIIGRVLTTSVFEELLFGANQMQMQMLEAQDHVTIQHEAVRSILGGDTLTPYFWDQVDRLAMQTTSMLLPLVRIMDEWFPEANAESLRKIHQDVHDIVAEAGYLSIGTRWSKDIFRFSWPLPGQPWDLDQRHYDEDIYNRSKAAADKLDSLTRQRWESERQGKAGAPAEPVESTSSYYVRQARASLANALLLNPLQGNSQSPPDDAAIAAANEPAMQGDAVGGTWFPPSRIAKVQIVLWPMLQRFAMMDVQYSEASTTSSDDSSPDAAIPSYFRHDDAQGETITTLFKSYVVYYIGLVAPAGEQLETQPTLDQWVREQQRLRRRRRRLWLLQFSVCFLVMWGAALTLGVARNFPDSEIGGLVNKVNNAVHYVGFEALGFFLRTVGYAFGCLSILAGYLWYLGSVPGVAVWDSGSWTTGSIGLQLVTCPLIFTMDASALLQSQGWRGKGFSLHPTDSKIGLARPLLISRNTDGRGIGNKTHYTSDQWWLDAFDQKLKGLDTSKKGTVTQSVDQGKLDVITNGVTGKYSGAAGLYASFVKGEMLVGTTDQVMTDESSDATPAGEDRDSIPRLKETKEEEERRGRREARQLKKAQKATKKAAKKAVEAARARRKATRKAAKKEAKKEAKRARKGAETKEERRARRADRRARKDAKRRERETSTKKVDEG
ncbi:hypothetical protein B0T17DRAFT_615746 [Bombardia bombarda]|uniref:Uncharacterized protein n=1 Tax=Bombardia bombarda TaxID=252184 RepID=A0AA39X9X9_9PEZI|nr:hypothetical protein B0T17DRAFT_615746 [Bombardia bombarda]